MKKLKKLLRGLLVSILYVRDSEHSTQYKAHKMIDNFIAYDGYYKRIKRHFIGVFLTGIFIGFWVAFLIVSFNLS